ncbi:MAG: universal stress protein [Xanthomonadales bacterium]|nr:universal stress protein [Gammaproteobacteria bacterium]MBT8049706.1 universal stress protein [Gammaproteobacteria bacterium]MBT8055696.1 universal stress protein [Gammaproteobacteria bacterium]NNJ78266.1 universal stress protein [Xanthomonadales bacterium]NNL04145.1 universal stress protein [Xanthomonadales bacterium]
MSKVLLVGVDCSDCSNRALEYAAKAAEKSKLQMIVVHVIDWSPFSFNTAKENEERHQRREAELDRAHKEIVDPVVSHLREQGLYARGVVRHGHPAETVNALAQEFGATNIIIGKTGSSRLKTQLFGSVANTLVQISELPVTVVP